MGEGLKSRTDARTIEASPGVIIKLMRCGKNGGGKKTPHQKKNFRGGREGRSTVSLQFGEMGKKGVKRKGLGVAKVEPREVREWQAAAL